METAQRITGLGGVFFKARNPAKLGAWYKKHLGLPVQEWGGCSFAWRDAKNPKQKEHVWIDPKGIEKSDYGQFGWIKDGEGNRIELWQPPRQK